MRSMLPELYIYTVITFRYFYFLLLQLPGHELTHIRVYREIIWLSKYNIIYRTKTSPDLCRAVE